MKGSSNGNAPGSRDGRSPPAGDSPDQGNTVPRPATPDPRSKLATLDYSVLQQCMHCGMCLPTCPTYMESGRERHSPRGRIALMRAIADGELEATRAFGEEMSYCLGCLACVTACPAGVDYTTLFETARAEVERTGVLRTPARSSLRWFAFRVVFTRPRLLRTLGHLLRFWQRSGARTLCHRLGLMRLLPRRLRELEPQAPVMCSRFSNALIAPVERPSAGATRYRVLMLTGCVQDLAFSDVNRATVDVLLENGCEVLTPPVQSCCGSLQMHNGDDATARKLARRQLDEVDLSQIDAIISNAGGCGSHLRHYNTLLRDDPRYAERAAEWSRKLRDIHEWLVEIGFRKPRPPDGGSPGMPPVAVTYHESCHLCHGQKISRQPRQILKELPGVAFRECAEATWCCGSAGIYSLTQPATATWLRDRKLGHLRATGASVVAMANPGCHLHVANGFRAAADSTAGGITTPRIAHPIVLLAEAYAAEKGRIARQ